ncbi:MAG: RluA family pseudouridine synthase [Alphaproteobacteria bacterium]|nr:RluA family pseudouridine synthase [Alphaproteobacteria bacterium]
MESSEKRRVELRTVAEPDDGIRLDRWFKIHFPSLGHGPLEKMLRKGQIRIGGSRAKASDRVVTGQEIRIPPDVPRIKPHGGQSAPRSRAANRPSRIEAAAIIAGWTIFEDDFILALNKPFGLAVQGGTGTSRHIDGYLAALERNGDRPRLVHRLDRDTGGLLLLAKTRAAAASISLELKQRRVEKTYWALTARGPRPREGRIDLPLAKGPISGLDEQIERVAPNPKSGAKVAVTDFQTIEQAGQGPAFLALRPVTGRTHQLRAHCAAIEAPIVGDGKYGGAIARLDGVSRKLHLFCRSMSFIHPGTGKERFLAAPLHGHMLDTWRFFDFPTEIKVDWPSLS